MARKCKCNKCEGGGDETTIHLDNLMARIREQNRLREAFKRETVRPSANHFVRDNLGVIGGFEWREVRNNQWVF